MDHMGISKLPKAGPDFRAKNHISSFRRKLKSACRHGNLKNLEDNIPAIVEVVKKYEEYIQEGRFSYRQKTAARRKIKKIDDNLTKDDIREIDKILDHLRGS